MSWRTVPAFIVGVLATLAASLVVLCRGPARADSAVTGRIVRWWAAAWLRAAEARVVVRGLELVRAGHRFTSWCPTTSPTWTRWCACGAAAGAAGPGQA